MDGDGTVTAIVRVMIGREPIVRPVITVSNPYATWPIVSWDEPPHVGVEVPAGMHEDVVHTLDDAVAVHPHVLAVCVRPVSVDPNPVRALHGGLRDLDRLRKGRRRLFGRCNRLWLLHDDDRLTANVLGRAILDLDDHVVRRGRVDGRRGVDDDAARIAGMGDVELVSRRPIPSGFAVVRRYRRGHRRNHHAGSPRNASRSSQHHSSFTCRHSFAPGHLGDVERARPARQIDQKVLLLRPSE
jgi:hypothetical protein